MPAFSTVKKTIDWIFLTALFGLYFFKSSAADMGLKETSYYSALLANVRLYIAVQSAIFLIRYVRFLKVPRVLLLSIERGWFGVGLIMALHTGPGAVREMHWTVQHNTWKTQVIHLQKDCKTLQREVLQQSHKERGDVTATAAQIEAMRSIKSKLEALYQYALDKNLFRSREERERLEAQYQLLCILLSQRQCKSVYSAQDISMLSSEEAYYCTLAPKSNLPGGLNPRIAAKTVYELATLMSNFLNFLDALGPLTESGQIRQEIRDMKVELRILRQHLQAYQDQHGRPSYDIMERIQVVGSRVSELAEHLKEISQENRREIERLERLYFLPTVPHPTSPCTIF